MSVEFRLTIQHLCLKDLPVVIVSCLSLITNTGIELGRPFSSTSYTRTEYVDGGTVMLLETDSSLSPLNKVLNLSGDPSSLWRTRKSPLADELVIKFPVMTASLLSCVTTTFLTSNVAGKKTIIVDHTRANRQYGIVTFFTESNIFTHSV